jgi:hypothetical protein
MAVPVAGNPLRSVIRVACSVARMTTVAVTVTTMLPSFPPLFATRFTPFRASAGLHRG